MGNTPICVGNIDTIKREDETSLITENNRTYRIDKENNIKKYQEIIDLCDEKKFMCNYLIYEDYDNEINEEILNMLQKKYHVIKKDDVYTINWQII